MQKKLNNRNRSPQPGFIFRNSGRPGRTGRADNCTVPSQSLATRNHLGLSDCHEQTFWRQQQRDRRVRGAVPARWRVRAPPPAATPTRSPSRPGTRSHRPVTVPVMRQPAAQALRRRRRLEFQHSFESDPIGGILKRTLRTLARDFKLEVSFLNVFLSYFPFTERHGGFWLCRPSDSRGRRFRDSGGRGRGRGGVKNWRRLSSVRQNRPRR